MARTKKTGRKEGKGPGLAIHASALGKKPPGKSMKVLKSTRRRRYRQCFAILREIRRAQKAVDLLIPKAAFQRVVRQLVEESLNLNYRWKRSALLALQEMAEDYLIEYNNDMKVLAAHSRRVTIMPKDSFTLKVIRWRYDKLLVPNPIVDPKMRDILAIPPARAPKENLNIVKITHDRDTRARAAQEAEREMHKQERKAKEAIEDAKKTKSKTYKEMTATLEASCLRKLSRFPNGFYAFFNFCQGERQLTIDKGDVEILRRKKEQITDTIIYASMK